MTQGGKTTSQEPGDIPRLADPVVEQIQSLGLELTRENYLTLAFGDPEAVLTPEQEGDLPEELQRED